MLPLRDKHQNNHYLTKLPSRIPTQGIPCLQKTLSPAHNVRSSTESIKSVSGGLIKVLDVRQ